MSQNLVFPGCFICVGSILIQNLCCWRQDEKHHLCTDNLFSLAFWSVGKEFLVPGCSTKVLGVNLLGHVGRWSHSWHFQNNQWVWTLVRLRWHAQLWGPAYPNFYIQWERKMDRSLRKIRALISWIEGKMLGKQSGKCVFKSYQMSLHWWYHNQFPSLP